MPIAVPRDLVVVTGADARRYLHGQISQNLQSLSPGGSTWTLVLAPNGRVDALARARCVDDERFELDLEQGFGDGLAVRLDRFRIRVDVEIDVVSTELPDGSDLTGWWGIGAWLDGVQPVAGANADGGSADAYEVARVAAGWPAMGSEIVPGERIPAEVAVVPVAVDFTKGCYPGQELVERMDSRGAEAPRHLRVLDVGDDARPGDPVADPDRSDAEPIGVITSVAGGRALAYVRRGAAVGAAPGPTSA